MTLNFPRNNRESIMNKVTSGNKCVLGDATLSERYLFKKKTEYFIKKKINECDECHFSLKTAKYIKSKIFNGIKCLTDKCNSFVYDLVNVEKSEDVKHIGTNSNSK